VASESTLCIIKPDAVEARYQAKIIQRIIDEGFAIEGLRQLRLERGAAEGFYAVHRERPFFGELVEYMMNGPVIVIALKRDNAVAYWRQVIGATNPEKADPGTLRKQFGKSLTANALHGSDSTENGLRETAYFFTGTELGR
jgi:nucleoside-diphosphate kinase